MGRTGWGWGLRLQSKAPSPQPAPTISPVRTCAGRIDIKGLGPLRTEDEHFDDTPERGGSPEIAFLEKPYAGLSRADVDSPESPRYQEIEICGLKRSFRSAQGSTLHQQREESQDLPEAKAWTLGEH